MLHLALGKAIIFQDILPLFDGKILGERVYKQVTVLCADGAVAGIGGVLMQGWGYREAEPHSTAMAVTGVGAALACGGGWKWHIDIKIALTLTHKVLAGRLNGF